MLSPIAPAPRPWLWSTPAMIGAEVSGCPCGADRIVGGVSGAGDLRGRLCAGDRRGAHRPAQVDTGDDRRSADMGHTGVCLPGCRCAHHRGGDQRVPGGVQPAVPVSAGGHDLHQRHDRAACVRRAAGMAGAPRAESARTVLGDGRAELLPVAPDRQPDHCAGDGRNRAGGRRREPPLRCRRLYQHRGGCKRRRRVQSVR